MENRGFIILIVLLLVIPLWSFAYDGEKTHQVLTQEAIKLFNHYYPVVALSDKDKENIIAGSWHEDDGMRAVYHFYDPVYNRGLEGQFESSKMWAEDTLGQGQSGGQLAGALSSVFTAQADYSWDRAIYDYLYGDKNRALQNLGHIVHLVEDATVPDHTRNDPHPPYLNSVFDQESPYEAYGMRFSRGNFTITDSLIGQNKMIPSYSALNQYFDSAANYSNTNFFSKDTILDKKYLQPKIVKRVGEKLNNKKYYLFGQGANDIYLARIDERRDLESNSVLSEYYLLDNDYLVLSDYWRLLSEQAVLNGAGVIKLFFDQVEQERQTHRLAEKNKSWLAKGIETMASGVHSLLADVSQTWTKNTATVVTLAPTTTPMLQTMPPPIMEKPKLEDHTGFSTDEIGQLYQALESLQSTLAIYLLNRNSTTTFSDLGSLTIAQQKVIRAVTSMSIGDEIIVLKQKVESVIATTTIEQNLPVITITEPAVFPYLIATTSVLIRGSSSNASLIFTSGGAETALPAPDGSWQIELNNLVNGTSTVTIFVKNEEGLTNEGVPIVLVVAPLIPPSVQTLKVAITECTATFIPGYCFIPFRPTLTLSWPQSSEVTSYKIIHQYVDEDIDEQIINSDGSISYAHPAREDIIASTTELTGVIAVPNQYSFRPGDYQVIAYDQEGRTVASCSLPWLEFRPNSPLMINEIGWLGTATDTPADEWVELYNDSQSIIALDNIRLIDGGGRKLLDLSGAVLAKSYYLIERSDDQVISDVSADLINDFSTPTGVKVFPRADFSLGLVISNSEAEEKIIDQVPLHFDPLTAYEWNSDYYPPVLSVERKWPEQTSNDVNNWMLAGSHRVNGHNRIGEELVATPREKNGASVPVGW